MLHRSVIGGSILMLALAVEGGAQTQLRILGINDQPIPGALVEIMGEGRQLGWVTAGADGRVEVPAESWSEARRLNIRHIGYQPHILAIGAVPDDGVVRIQPRAVRISGLEVVASSTSCPVQDDPAARAIWAQVADQYADDTGTRDVEGQWLAERGPVRETELFESDPDRLQRGHYGWIGGTSGAEAYQRPLLESVVENDGYAWEPSLGRSSRRHLNWAYPELEGRHAYHFATSAFGARHDMAVAERGAGWVSLVFCPKEEGRDGASIFGRLTMSDDGWFLSAEWLVDTEDPDEGAGGEVTFMTVEEQASQKPHLLAARGLFFRHNGRPAPYPDLPRDYYRELRIYLDWQVGSGR